MPSQVNSTIHLKNNQLQSFLNFQKIAEEEILPNSFCEDYPDTKARQRHYQKTIGASELRCKGLNKILANSIQQHIKGSYTMNKLDLSAGMPGCFNIQKKKKNQLM